MTDDNYTLPDVVRLNQLGDQVVELLRKARTDRGQRANLEYAARELIQSLEEELEAIADSDPDWPLSWYWERGLR